MQRFRLFWLYWASCLLLQPMNSGKRRTKERLRRSRSRGSGKSCWPTGRPRLLQRLIIGKSLRLLNSGRSLASRWSCAISPGVSSILQRYRRPLGRARPRRARLRTSRMMKSSGCRISMKCRARITIRRSRRPALSIGGCSTKVFRASRRMPPGSARLSPLYLHREQALIEAYEAALAGEVRR